MERLLLLLLGGILTSAPTVLAPGQARGKGRPPSTTPACPLRCPPGYQVALYTWELHPERTIYDEQGKVQVPPEGPWKVSCALRCELRDPNQETKVWEDKKVLCSSGGEPAPYTGPWRITGPLVRECAARENNGCGLHCYAIRPPRTGGKKRAK